MPDRKPTTLHQYLDQGFTASPLGVKKKIGTRTVLTRQAGKKASELSYCNECARQDSAKSVTPQITVIKHSTKELVAWICKMAVAKSRNKIERKVSYKNGVKIDALTGRKLCVQPDCTNVYYARGRCKRHHNKDSRPQTLSRTTSTTTVKRRNAYTDDASRFCVVPGCNNTKKLKGKCKSHGGFATCLEPQCTKRDAGGGKCREHGGGKNKCQHKGCRRYVIECDMCKAHQKELHRGDICNQSHAKTKKTVEGNLRKKYRKDARHGKAVPNNIESKDGPSSKDNMANLNNTEVMKGVEKSTEHTRSIRKSVSRTRSLQSHNFNTSRLAQKSDTSNLPSFRWDDLRSVEEDEHSADDDKIVLIDLEAETDVISEVNSAASSKKSSAVATQRKTQSRRSSVKSPTVSRKRRAGSTSPTRTPKRSKTTAPSKIINPSLECQSAAKSSSTQSGNGISATRTTRRSTRSGVNGQSKSINSSLDSRPVLESSSLSSTNASPKHSRSSSAAATATRRSIRSQVRASRSESSPCGSHSIVETNNFSMIQRTTAPQVQQHHRTHTDGSSEDSDLQEMTIVVNGKAQRELVNQNIHLDSLGSNFVFHGPVTIHVHYH